ncbi:MAG: hypothetical protein WC656_09890 [Sulfurimonas sp.]|jgi:Txe/YoeB family toxin of Txe-Axe toxin-antitoxin module
MYQLIFMSQAQKDAKKLSSSGLKPKTMKLLEIIQKNPLQYPPEYEYLRSDIYNHSSYQNFIVLKENKRNVKRS